MTRARDERLLERIAASGAVDLVTVDALRAGLDRVRTMPGLTPAGRAEIRTRILRGAAAAISAARVVVRETIRGHDLPGDEVARHEDALRAIREDLADPEAGRGVTDVEYRDDGRLRVDVVHGGGAFNLTTRVDEPIARAVRVLREVPPEGGRP